MAGGKTAWAAAALLLASAAFWSGIYPSAVFTVRLPEEADRLAAAVRTGPGEVMRLSYHHSVEKTPVEGRFVVAEGPCLRIRETRMASVGTGLPNTAPTRTRRENGWMVVDEGMRWIDGFRYRFMNLNHTRLTVGDAPVPLEGIRNGSILFFNVESVRNFRWWAWLITETDWKSPNREKESIRERNG